MIAPGGGRAQRARNLGNANADASEPAQRAADLPLATASSRRGAPVTPGCGLAEARPPPGAILCRRLRRLRSSSCATHRSHGVPIQAIGDEPIDSQALSGSDGRRTSTRRYRSRTIGSLPLAVLCLREESYALSTSEAHLHPSLPPEGTSGRYRSPYCVCSTNPSPNHAHRFSAI